MICVQLRKTRAEIKAAPPSLVALLNASAHGVVVDEIPMTSITIGSALSVVSDLYT